MAEKRARIQRITTIAPDVLLVDAAMVEPATIAPRPGQFVSLRVDETGGVRRSYSLASPAERRDGFELVVKVLPHGAGSAWFAARRAGDELGFTGPMGFFVPDAVHAGDVVFVATGTGIAAALPMLQAVLARPAEVERGRVRLWWGLRRDEDVYLRERLDGLGAASARLEAHICLSRPSDAWAGERGRVTPHVLAALPGLDRPVFYLVGHEDMIRELSAGLIARGVDRKRQLRSEVFYPSVDGARPPA